MLKRHTSRAEVLRRIEASEGFLPVIGKGSGWVPEEEDRRDYPIERLLQGRLQAVQPRAVNNGKFTPGIRDQGQYGACTGYGTAYAIEYLRRKESDGPGDYETRYSPGFLYNLARMAQGWLDEDSGAYGRDAVNAARQVGVARERDFMWYEPDSFLFAEPTPKAYESAKSWRLGAHYKATKLDEVRAALAAGFPVVFGFTCFSNLGAASTWDTGRILVPTYRDTIEGGHWIMADGYDDANRFVTGPNSWGTYWGDAGRYYLPYAYFEKGWVDDIWVLEGESDETKFPRRAR